MSSASASFCGHVVGHAALPAVHVGAAQVLGAHLLAGGRLHQRRAGQEDGAGALHDDRLVGHGRHVGPAGRAGAHDRRHLRASGRREPGLVVEDPAEVLLVGEDLVLKRQEGSARVDQVDAGEMIGQRHLLGPHVLPHGQRQVGAALDRGVVGHDQALHPLHHPDAGDHARRGGVVVVQAPGRQRREFEEGGAGVDQPVDAVADEEFAAGLVAGPRLGRAALPHLVEALQEFVAQAPIVFGVGLELGVGRSDL